MSRQLSRIRSIISEIEEIQKQGQSEGKAQLQQRAHVPIVSAPAFTSPPTPVSTPVVEAPVKSEAPAPVSVRTEAGVEPEVQAMAELTAQILDFKSVTKPVVATEEVKPGKIAMQLTGNIVIALQIESTDEVVEIRQVKDSIEIRFTDGKAVHLPLKNVA